MDIDNRLKQSTSKEKIILRLSSSAIRDFQELYYKEFQVKLSIQEANRLGIILLRLFSVVYRPIKKKEYE